MDASLYRSIWRWHFYAGLFVMPFVLILSLTGAIYLWKPQIDRWEERGFRDLPSARPVSPIVQVEAAKRIERGARFDSYRVPTDTDDAALVHVALTGGGMRDVFVAPDGRVVGVLDPARRISNVVAEVHGNLLLGRWGDRLVELAASWTIVMILTGLYLWWPRGIGAGLAGVLWPRRRVGMRDFHAVTGFWVAGLALVTLASGLPWAGAWGSVFAQVRQELGLVKDRPDWKQGPGALHAEHDHAAMVAATPLSHSLALLPALVERARAERLAFPALVKPPGSLDRAGMASDTWTIKSEAQDRTQVRSVAFDAHGREVMRSGFADKHPIDRAINLGIAWHEGQLFGLANQLIGTMTAAAMAGLVITSFVLWRRRRPEGTLGAPRPAAMPARMPGVVAIVAVLCLVLPLLALSLGVLLTVEALVLRRFETTRAWLGLRLAD